MKNYYKLPYSILLICIVVVFLNLAVVLFILGANIYKYSNIGSLMYTFCIFILVSIIQLIVNRGWVRISEISARFTLDNLPNKMIAIETDLNAGNITKDVATNMKRDLQEESDFFGSIDGCAKIFSGISKILTFGLIIISIILLLLDIFKVFTIENNYIIIILMSGIISQFILLFTTIYVRRLLTKIYKENK